MDIRQLKYFAQVVESGSVSEAARRLCMAQPALSQQMAKLEKEVGKSLFARSVRGMATTHNGQALYHHAKVMLRQFDESIAIARQDTKGISGRVRVGLSAPVASIVGLPLLHRLKQTHPGITLNLVTTLPARLAVNARLDQLDLAVLYSHEGAVDLASEPLFDEEIYAILNRTTGLAAIDAQSLDIRELARLPLVVSPESRTVLGRCAIGMERAGLRPNVVAEFDSLLLLMRYIADKDVATIQPMAATHMLGAPDHLRCLRISGVPPLRNFLLSLPPAELSLSVQVVREELRTLVRDLVTSGEWAGVRLVPSN